MIQQAVDRKANQMGNETKRLREENEKLKKEHLSAEERAELAIKKNFPDFFEISC